MHVMTAGMHHRHGLPRAVSGSHLAGVGQTRRFLNRQRVHVGAQHDSRSVTVAQQTDNAGLSQICGHFITGSTKTVRRDASGPCFLHGQFWMSMDIFVDRL